MSGPQNNKQIVTDFLDLVFNQHKVDEGGGCLSRTDLHPAQPGGCGWPRGLHDGQFSETQTKASLQVCLEDAQMGQ